MATTRTTKNTAARAKANGSTRRAPKSFTQVPRSANSARKERNRHLVEAAQEFDSTKPNYEKINAHLYMAEMLHYVKLDTESEEE